MWHSTARPRPIRACRTAAAPLAPCAAWQQPNLTLPLTRAAPRARSTLKGENGEDLAINAIAGTSSTDIAKGFAQNNYMRPCGQVRPLPRP